MSAIWGIVSWNKKIASDLRSKMDIPYRERCKIDSYRYFENEQSLFACGLQFLTNEAPNELLPIVDKKNEIIFDADCVLDNRDEIIDELLSSSIELPKGVSLSASSYSDISQLPDGSLIYLSYLAYGIDCLKHIRGVFSIAVYDLKCQTLFLAADQVASRSLYYYRDDNKVLFSTLLDPIKYAGHREINELYIKDYLCASGLVPNLVADETSIKDVYKVLPGRYLKITQDAISEHTYWSLGDAKHSAAQHATQLNSSCPEKVYGEMSSLKTVEDYAAYFNKIYTDAVSDSLRTCNNVAISMSSGYDSASIGAIASELLAKRNEKLYVYTYIPFEAPMDEHVKGYVYDETTNVKEIAKMHPNMETHFLNNSGKNCFEKTDEYMELMEIPYKAFINLPSLCEVYEAAVKDNCKLVLTGQNGNFTVSYGYIHTILYDLYCKKDYYNFFKYLNNYCKHEHISRKESLFSYLDKFKYFRKEKKKDNCSLSIDNPFVSASIQENYSYSKRLGFNQPDFLQNYVTEDLYHKYFLSCDACYTYFGEFDTKLSLKYGILLRDATKDIRVLAFCNCVPYRLFAHEGIPRYFIYSTMQNRLPASILEKWSRYGVQNSDWLNRVNRDFDEIIRLLANTLSSTDYNDFIVPDYIQDYLAFLKAPVPYVENDNFIYLSIIYLYKKYLKKEDLLFNNPKL